jgi:hypothetical protein
MSGTYRATSDHGHDSESNDRCPPKATSQYRLGNDRFWRNRDLQRGPSVVRFREVAAIISMTDIGRIAALRNAENEGP